MKTFNHILIFFALLALALATPSCKDNILTPVTNNKSADSLTALITTANSRLVSIAAKDKTLQIQLAKFHSTADSLNAISSSNGNYLQSVQYTVYLLDGGNSVTGVYYNGSRTCENCKVNGVDGATVTVNSNGQTYTALSADGRAIFNNLQVAGLATVSVAASGYTNCSYTTYFNPKGSNNGGISSVSFYSSSFSGTSNTVTAVAPASTTGSGSGALFNIVIGNTGNVASITVASPGTGYKNGDQITFNGSQLCYCGGTITYTVTTGPVNPGQTGAVLNASTNVLLLPTAGKNVTTFTGQLYINKSSMDDTLGHMYNNSTDKARYLTFISPLGPYHGYDYSTYYSQEYAQNQYYNINNEKTIPGNAISFTSLTTLAGINYLYGYPSYVSNYYAYSQNYQFMPGDIMSVSYTGLTAFATLSAAGIYTLSVPSYQNNPGTTVGTTSALSQGNGNAIYYQDNYTFLSTSNYTGSTAVTLNLFDATTYAVTKINSYYEVTKKFDYYPYIETDDGNYSQIDGHSGDTQYFSALPGQTVTRNVFFFAYSPSSQ